jgi:uncharacterized protein
MLINDIKKANMMALKNHDQDARASLSVLINRYQQLDVENRAKGKETTDAEVISLIQKCVKELEEEKAMFAANNRPENVESLTKQIETIKVYLPKMMSEDEIKTIIEGLDDKSIKNIMSTFKTNYAGKVDMSIVSKIAKSYN